MNYQLRDYQQEATDSGIEFFNDKKDKSNSIIVIPTGGGKSLVVANIAKQLDGNTIVFQPSKELLEQNFEKYVSYGEYATIYSASKGIKKVSKVTFATIGSVVKKPELFKDFKYCIIDECHKVSPDKSSMYSTFLNELNIKILGLTATPIRLKSYNYPVPHSKLGMLNRQRPRTFSKYIHITQIKELVEKNFFAPTKYVSIDFDKSTLRVNSTGADFTEISISKALSEQGINDKIIHYAKEAIKKGRKHILIFTPLVADAEYIASQLNGHYVCGKTKKKERELILNAFKSGEIKVIANVGVLQIGFDFPALDTIILGRPTMSLALYYQMIGRGVRPFSSKEYCLILDLVGNFDTFGRVEDLEIKNKNGWGVYSGNRLLTNVDMSEGGEIVDEVVMPFGKFKGEPLPSIPNHYLKWVYKNVEKKPYNKEVFDYIENNII